MRVRETEEEGEKKKKEKKEEEEKKKKKKNKKTGREMQRCETRRGFTRVNFGVC